MLHKLCNLGMVMAVNRNSGRVVVNVDPTLKLDLHAALARDGKSLKDWFIQQARQYLAERVQPELTFSSSRPDTIEPTSGRGER